MISGYIIGIEDAYISGMAVVSLLASLCCYTALIAGPALIVAKLVKGHKANQRAARARRTATMAPKVWNIG